VVFKPNYTFETAKISRWAVHSSASVHDALPIDCVSVRPSVCQSVQPDIVTQCTVGPSLVGLLNNNGV